MYWNELNPETECDEEFSVLKWKLFVSLLEEASCYKYEDTQAALWKVYVEIWGFSRQPAPVCQSRISSYLEVGTSGRVKTSDNIWPISDYNIVRSIKPGLPIRAAPQFMTRTSCGGLKVCCCFKTKVLGNQTRTLQENCTLVSLMNIDAKIFYKISANWIQQYTKNITHTLQSSGIYLKDARMAQHLQINWCHATC